MNPRYGYPYNGFRVLRFHAGLSRPVTKRVLWFGIFSVPILPTDARCRAVPRGSFAIPFANFFAGPCRFTSPKRTNLIPALMSVFDPKRTLQHALGYSEACLNLRPKVSPVCSVANATARDQAMRPRSPQARDRLEQRLEET